MTDNAANRRANGRTKPLTTSGRWFPIVLELLRRLDHGPAELAVLVDAGLAELDAAVDCGFVRTNRRGAYRLTPSGRAALDAANLWRIPSPASA
jgi:hypothetical protein